MSKADASGPSGKDDASSGAGNEFAIHEHIGRHLKTMFDEVANEPIPEKLRQLLDTLEHREAKEGDASHPDAKVPQQG
ncbi:MAG: NepR family anti-sigma factor [Hyphomicrobiaceae bacterium]